nr:UPF0223 family protein [Lentibacillus sp. CBA3610]
MNTNYPLDDSWSTQEVIDVVISFPVLKKLYENKVSRMNCWLHTGSQAVVP